MANFFVTIRGIVDNPAVTEINVRSGPGTSFELLFKVPVGMADLPVTEAAIDKDSKNFQGKTYQWLKVTFPNGQSGWTRDDLVEVIGEGSAFGYGTVTTKTLAFQLNRSSAAVAVSPPVPPSPAAPAPAAPTAPVPSPTPTPTTTKGVCTAIVMMRDGANSRTGPSVNAGLVAKQPRDTRFNIEEVRQGDGGDIYKWVRGTILGKTIWMREDVLRYEGDSETYGLGKSDLYPAPMQSRWWVRGFTGGNPGDHWGWDFGAATGEPIYCGPKGGLVTASVECSRCAGGKSFKSYGIPLSNPAALSDPAWNYGYGHYVIVRYLNEHLPESSRQALAQRGLAGAHLYAMYAHVNTRDVPTGMNLGPNARIATCGDTGNSEATHLHLEVRASMNPNDANWAGMKNNLLDPVIMFGK